ncbi:MAG: D-alanyl-D-alanine carboxypeptidase/D-alanyl-D-alanine-endopeptidase [Planctomycetes bacterium]|nr:D-alanyl-D-alanine carboxypeptidase/D-alanyl-D-alanine-endopeptidase [Planctomycetota bacterium]
MNGRYRVAVILAWIFAALAGGCGHDWRLATRLDPVLDRLAAQGAVVHARVLELPSRRELYARNADRACTPASNLKLVVSAAGLDLFGPRHTFKTYLAMDGDDLWIVGTGDPGPGDGRLARAKNATPLTMLETWAAVLKQRGIARIAGDLVYYDLALEDEQTHPTWRGFLLHWYAAPVAGLNFNDNCVDITVEPSEEGQPARYEVMPPAREIQVINECTTAKEGSASIVKLPGGNIYKLKGRCHEKIELISKPVDDPGAFFADALRVQLEAQGITVAGRIRRSETRLGGCLPPPADKSVATYETPIVDVLSRINKNSQNLFAECLCKMTGREWKARHGRDVPGSWANGSEAIRAFVRRCGIDDRSLVVADGSGLSVDNRVTARLLTDLLAEMASRPNAEVYRASLSVAGVDGSLRNRMHDLTGHVFGKTGYIGGVSSMSGYIKTYGGTWLAVSIVYNGIPEHVGDDEDVAPFTKLQDEACRILVDWPALSRPSTQPATTTAP